MTPDEQLLAQTLQLMSGQIVKLTAENRVLTAVLVLLWEKQGGDREVFLKLLKADVSADHESLLLMIGDQSPDAAALVDIYKRLARYDKPPLE